MTGHFESVEISSKPAKNTKNYLEILAEQPHFTEKTFRERLLVSGRLSF